MTEQEFQQKVLVKLDVLTRETKVMGQQMTALVRAYRLHGERLSEVEASCLANHGTPIPRRPR